LQLLRLSGSNRRLMAMDWVPALEDFLNSRQPRTHTEWEATPAAVLVPFYQEREDWHLLLTRRTNHVNSHRGQVSFPGGAIDASDASVEAAALREAHEEIGLASEGVRLLGRMDSLLTVTQFHVTPVVATIPWPIRLRLQPLEVAAVFGVPLAWLRDPANLSVEQRQGPMLGKPVPVYHFVPFQDEIIWGVTARIIVDLLALLDQLTPG